MTKGQLEKKVRYLEKKIRYYCRVYPGSSKIPVFKSMYRYYKKLYNISVRSLVSRVD